MPLCPTASSALLAISVFVVNSLFIPRTVVSATSRSSVWNDSTDGQPSTCSLCCVGRRCHSCVLSPLLFVTSFGYAGCVRFRCVLLYWLGYSFCRIRFPPSNVFSRGPGTLCTVVGRIHRQTDARTDTHTTHHSFPKYVTHGDAFTENGVAIVCTMFSLFTESYFYPHWMCSMTQVGKEICNYMYPHHSTAWRAGVCVCVCFEDT